jgi:hypothetical protein
MGLILRFWSRPTPRGLAHVNGSVIGSLKRGLWKNLNMTIVEITGGMLRAARSLTGLSQQELADRASISRPSLTAGKIPRWES